MKEKKSNLTIWIWNLIVFVSGVILDQWTKVFMTQLLKGKPSIPIIKDILELHYLENRGAAFGMLQGKRYYFIIIAVVVFVVIGWIMWKLPREKKFNKLHITLSLILAGAIGNSIDRVAKGYVVDFIYFKLIDFPIFNVADIYITVSTIWLAIMLLFLYKEEDFDFLNHKKESPNSESEISDHNDEKGRKSE